MTTAATTAKTFTYITRIAAGTNNLLVKNINRKDSFWDVRLVVVNDEALLAKLAEAARSESGEVELTKEELVKIWEMRDNKK